MQLKCKGFKRYKGVRRPGCGCLRCWMRYVFNRQARARKPIQMPDVTPEIIHEGV